MYTKQKTYARAHKKNIIFTIALICSTSPLVHADNNSSPWPIIALYGITATATVVYKGIETIAQRSAVQQARIATDKAYIQAAKASQRNPQHLKNYAATVKQGLEAIVQSRLALAQHGLSTPPNDVTIQALDKAEEYFTYLASTTHEEAKALAIIREKKISPSQLQQLLEGHIYDNEHDNLDKI